MNKNHSFSELHFIKRILISAVLLLLFAVISLLLIAYFQPLTTASSHVQKEIDPSTLTQLWKPSIFPTQTEPMPCLTSGLVKNKSEISPTYEFFSRNEITEKRLFVGQGKMQDLFYRYPCPPAISGDLSIQPKTQIGK